MQSSFGFDFEKGETFSPEHYSTQLNVFYERAIQINLNINQVFILESFEVKSVFSRCNADDSALKIRLLVLVFYPILSAHIE